MLSNFLKNITSKNKKLFINLFSSYTIKGVALIIGFIMMPLYVSYFNNNTVLGFWFTILNILNWILSFDLGIGNGLRNKLSQPIIAGDQHTIKKYISSTYVILSLISFIVIAIGSIFIYIIDWNNFLNINENIITSKMIITSVLILFYSIMIQFLLKIIFSILFAYQTTFLSNLSSLMSTVFILIFVWLVKVSSIDKALLYLAFINLIATNVPTLLITIITFKTKLSSVRPSIRYYDNSIAKSILKLGGLFFWIQISFMVITSTNQLLISRFFDPSLVVEYQVYYKIFGFFLMMFALISTPVWSAVSHANEEKRFSWIRKTYYVLNLLTLVVFVVMVIVGAFMQQILNIWLGDYFITIKAYYVLVFVFDIIVMISILAVTSIANGLNILLPQLIMNVLSAIFKFVIVFLGYKYIHSWILVNIANIIVMLPNVIIQHIYMNKILHKKELSHV